jgi:hypothetical protein
MGWFENVIIENKKIQNERFEVMDKDSLYFLGPDLTLSECLVVMKVPSRRIHILGARFLNCTFDVKQEVKNQQGWLRASLKGCRFKGRLSGCDFGHSPEYDRPEYQIGSIEDCDFTEARLHGCRFMGCDPSTLKLPRWPCFTFLEPIRHAPELRRVKWPGRFGGVIIDDLHTNPSATHALTFHAPSIAKQMETTEDELRTVIEKFDCFVY